MTDIPPVTDHLAIALRAYTGPTFTPVPSPNGLPKKEWKAPPPASDWTLVFDTETTTDASQALRIGSYQFRCGDGLDEAGPFYDPEGVSPIELKTLRTYATQHGLKLRS